MNLNREEQRKQIKKAALKRQYPFDKTKKKPSIKLKEAKNEKQEKKNNTLGVYERYANITPEPSKEPSVEPSVNKLTPQGNSNVKQKQVKWVNGLKLFG